MEIKKKLKEIVALYKLEKSLNDAFVEGNIDKVFFQNYLKCNKKSRKIIPIEMVDFAELSIDDHLGLDIKSNRNKLIILSEILKSITRDSKVNCIIDKDFDDYIQKISNKQLLRTDFSCLESYLFCNEVIDKFLEMVIGNFPFSAEKVITELSQVLKPLFAIRLIREINFKQAKLLKIDSNLNIDKITGSINFNDQDYLDKFIKANNLVKDSKFIRDEYDKITSSFKHDIRHYMQGHDFMSILYLYVNKIKNTNKFKEEQFDRVLFSTVENKLVDHFQLFQQLLTE